MASGYSRRAGVERQRVNQKNGDINETGEIAGIHDDSWVPAVGGLGTRAINWNSQRDRREFRSAG